MSTTLPDSDASAVFDFVAEFLEDLERGSLRPLADYLARFPGHEEEVAREYLELVDRNASGELGVVAEPGNGGDDRPRRLGPYRLVRELGRGGQGVVLLAEDLRQGRRVALKVLSSPFGRISEARRRRLRREAEVVARLEHPGICGVYEAELDGGTPYLAMRYVEGKTLAACISTARRREPASAPIACAPSKGAGLREILLLFERAARALHTAHEAGIVHRDVKPGNIMVTPDGAPVLLDFGLAWDEEAERAALTRTGETFGTPAYMPPEVFAGGGARLDRRADVYSLGAALYEALTLHPPFEGKREELARDVRSKPLPDPGRFNPAIPTDLKVVLETAMEKDPARRYASALRFADDLRRVRLFEPIHARRADPMLRFRRWMRRHPAIAAASAAIFVGLFIALAVSQVSLSQVRRERNEKESALQRSISAFLRDQATMSARMTPNEALMLASEAYRREPSHASHQVLLACLEALHTKQELVGHNGRVVGVDVSPTGDRIATASKDGTARVWLLGSDAPLFRLEGHEGPVRSARFSPDGGRVVTASDDRTARVWNLKSGRNRVLQGHVHAVHWAEFSPDGREVVTASDDGTVRVWNAGTGESRLVLERCDHGPVPPEPETLAKLLRVESPQAGRVEDYRDNRRRTEARFSRDGSRIFSIAGGTAVPHHACASAHAVQVWDARTGAKLAELAGHAESITRLIVNEDETKLVTASFDGRVLLWDLAGDLGAPEPKVLFEVADEVHGLAFVAGDARLAVAYDPQGGTLGSVTGACVLDLSTGASMELGNHGYRAVVDVAYAPRTQRLATIAYDGAMRLWDARTGELLGDFSGSYGSFQGVRWSPDETWLVTWERDAAQIWYGEPRPFLRRLEGHADLVMSARFDPAGARIVSASLDGTARVWDRASAAEVLAVSTPSGAPLERAVFSPDGRKLLTARTDGRADVWDAASGAHLRCLRGHSGELVAAAFHPTDPGIALTASKDGATAVWDVKTGCARWFQASEAETTRARFVGGGERVVTGAKDRSVRLWDAAIPRPLPADEEEPVPLWQTVVFEKSEANLNAVWDVAVSRDGSHLAIAGQNAGLWILNVHTGRVVSAMDNGINYGRLLFDAADQRLFAASKWGGGAMACALERPNGGALGFVGAPLQRAAHTFAAPHTSSITCAALIGEGLTATGSLDGTAKVWAFGHGAIRTQATFPHDDAVLDIAASPDGSEVVTACADGSLRLWPLDLLSVAERYQPHHDPVIVERVLASQGLK